MRVDFDPVRDAGLDVSEHFAVDQATVAHLIDHDAMCQLLVGEVVGHL